MTAFCRLKKTLKLSKFIIVSPFNFVFNYITRLILGGSGGELVQFAFVWETWELGDGVWWRGEKFFMIGVLSSEYMTVLKIFKTYLAAKLLTVSSSVVTSRVN